MNAHRHLLEGDVVVGPYIVIPLIGREIVATSAPGALRTAREAVRRRKMTHR